MTTFNFTDHDALKTGTDLPDAEAKLEQVKANAPDWFKFEPGFKFNYESDPAIYLGLGGYRDVDFDQKLVFKPCGVLITYRYKGEWHHTDLSSKDWTWEDCTPLDPDPS